MDDDNKILENALEEAKKELSRAAIGSEAERLLYRLFPQLEDDRDERIRRVLMKIVSNPSIQLKSDKHELLDYLESLKDLPKRDGMYLYYNRQFKFIGAPIFEETSDICKKCENKPNCGDQGMVRCNGFKERNSSPIKYKILLGLETLKQSGRDYFGGEPIDNCISYIKAEPAEKKDWRPTKEMMDALEEALVRACSYSYGRVLQDLYSKLSELQNEV